jgi:hypothetical protein
MVEAQVDPDDRELAHDDGADFDQPAPIVSRQHDIIGWDLGCPLFSRQPSYRETKVQGLAHSVGVISDQSANLEVRNRAPLFLVVKPPY